MHTERTYSASGAGICLTGALTSEGIDKRAEDRASDSNGSAGFNSTSSLVARTLDNLDHAHAIINAIEHSLFATGQSGSPIHKDMGLLATADIACERSGRLIQRLEALSKKL